MANTLLCARCQAVLTTNVGAVWVDHHPDGDSFREALRTECRICLQIWAQIERPTYLCHTKCIFLYLMDGSLYSVYISHNNRSGVLSLETSYETPILRLGNNTNSNQSFQFIISKYFECMKHHKSCTKSPPEPFLPQRLMHVGERGQKVTLVHREDISPHSFYVTLSHCWGQHQPLKLTASTSSKLQSGVELQELPKTFQDAIQVTQRLDVQWIWIDSLCIFQDSIDDWSIQASAMQDIYEYAVLNIAATAASDGTTGLFYERNPVELMPFNIETNWCGSDGSPEMPCSYLCSRPMTLTDMIDNAPLNKRGWVMQERLLSRRIVHFSQEAVYWECHELLASEIYPNGIPDSDSFLGERHTKKLKALLDTYQRSEEPEPRRLLYRYWGSFLEQYTSCKLTYSRDKFVAIAGVVRRVETVLQDELIAGLWRSRFIEQLCWSTFDYTGRGRPHNSAKPWIAPSWSWANCEYSSCSLVSGDTSTSTYLARLVNVHIHAENSGALIGGSVSLQCRLVPAKLHFTSEGGADVKNWMSLSSECYNSESPDTASLSVRLDGPCFTAVTSSPEDVFILPLLKCKNTFVPYTWCMAGIVVIPSGTEDGAYRRIGQFQGVYPKTRSYDASTEASAQHGGPRNIAERFYKEVMENYTEAEDQIIKIV